MYLAQLRERLIVVVKDRIRNGEVTERGLARLLGVSQPHVHNVLKGVRRPSVEVLDGMIRVLNVTLAELLEPEDLKCEPWLKSHTGRLFDFGVRGRGGASYRMRGPERAKPED